jgi:hypothetical protein
VHWTSDTISVAGEKLIRVLKAILDVPVDRSTRAHGRSSSWFEVGVLPPKEELR